VIPAGLLGVVGALWGAAPSVASPFRYGDARPATAEESAALEAGGICDASGGLSAAARPALDVLGTAVGFTRVYVTGGGFPNEYLVYFSPTGASASLINRGGDMELATPATADLLVAMIEMRIGSSALRESPFEASLSFDEAVVLAGLVDLQRRAVLSAFGAGKDADAVEASPAAVADAVAARGDDRQWLANVLLELGESDGLDADAAKVALGALAGRGLVTKGKGGSRLSDEALQFARRMLLFDVVVTLTSGHAAANGTVSVAGFTALQAGVRDVLYIDASEGEVELRSTSAAEILDYVNTFMTDPAVVARLDGGVGQAPPAAAAPAKQAFCTKCGSKLAPGAAFCVKCGQKVG